VLEHGAGGAGEVLLTWRPATSLPLKKKQDEYCVYHCPDVQQARDAQENVHYMQRPVVRVRTVHADKAGAHEQGQHKSYHRVDDAIFVGRIQRLLDAHENCEDHGDCGQHAALGLRIYI
jgi:hypothetical protein